MTTTAALLARVHREEWARVVAAVARRFADLDTAEEAAAEAFLTAVERWPDDGVPPNPALRTSGGDQVLSPPAARSMRSR